MKEYMFLRININQMNEAPNEALGSLKAFIVEAESQEQAEEYALIISENFRNVEKAYL